VLSDFGDADLLVVPVTSHPSRNESGVALADWKAARLKSPSTVRAEKFSTIAKSCVAQKLGKLPPVELARVKQTIGVVFKKITG
jgi:mRNA-degrading endonuclease toxin of MazEF toxin-antitoxin module